MKIMFCCCEDNVCIQIGELKIQPNDKATENKIRWWLLDMANEVVRDLLKPFEKVMNKSGEIMEAYKCLRKLKEDLEVLQDAIAQDTQAN